MPDKNTLGRQPLPPEKQLLSDWYANTVYSSREERERRKGSQKRRGIEGKGKRESRRVGDETGGDKPVYPRVPLYESYLKVRQGTYEAVANF